MEGIQQLVRTNLAQLSDLASSETVFGCFDWYWLSQAQRHLSKGKFACLSCKRPTFVFLAV